MGFKEGGKYLPGDYVDEGKLLLFIRDEVASRAPRQGRRLNAEKKRRKRKAESLLPPSLPPPKQRRGQAGAIPVPVLPEEGDDDESCSDLVLMYNTVRGYCSAVNELWAHQTSLGLHSAPRPQRVALTALKTSIARGEHQRRRAEFEDRGLATIRDGYTADQIPDVSRAVWGQSLGGNLVEQQFRT